MKIYNSLTRTIEDFQPREEGRVRMFVCGPTVYDHIHIGNARTFVFFDFVAKYLRYKGFDVDYIQNITDIDDKIINRAAENNISPLEWAKKYEEEFKKDAVALGITSPRYLRATDYIEEVKKQVKVLKEKGHAYLIENDGWYFDLGTFTQYGKLSGRTAEMADDAVSRIDENERKRNKGDFCLWKLSKEGEPSWPDDELGGGRPGWHIEDTAITENEFGPQYDLHGGGMDLMFPHHEAEIAQQESASGKQPFVKYWMHGAFLVNDEAKMSKSAGNFTTANELSQKYPKEVLRLYLLSSYYRTPLHFSDKVLRQSEGAASRIAQFKMSLGMVEESYGETVEVEGARKEFMEALDNDFNVSEALGHLFNFIRKANPLIIREALSKESAQNILKFLDEINILLGIIPEKFESAPDLILELVERREELRLAKRYDEADVLRRQINDSGWEIQDTAYGPGLLKIK